MQNTKFKTGLLLFLLVAVIIGFVYVVYFLGDKEIKEGTLVKENYPIEKSIADNTEYETALYEIKGDFPYYISR